MMNDKKGELTWISSVFTSLHLSPNVFLCSDTQTHWAACFSVSPGHIQTCTPPAWWLKQTLCTLVGRALGALWHLIRDIKGVESRASYCCRYNCDKRASLLKWLGRHAAVTPLGFFLILIIPCEVVVGGLHSFVWGIALVHKWTVDLSVKAFCLLQYRHDCHCHWQPQHL